jgi:hypothetical protein
VPALREDWNRARIFPYLVIDQFLPADDLTEILRSYPSPEAAAWTRKTYSHQAEKLQMTQGFPPPIEAFLALTATDEFRRIIEEITGIQGLLADPELVGGGLHQIERGGFLDVHIDFNFHPTTRLHRRLNLLLYLNEGWKDEYEGHLELWDMVTEGGPRCIERVAPLLNRVVIFATNEVSYHGHPVPLACPPGVTRKSLAIYYYSETRDDVKGALEHNTIYKQTTGTRGYVKTAISSARALRERLREESLLSVGAEGADKIYRKLRGLPPRNN